MYYVVKLFTIYAIKLFKNCHVPLIPSLQQPPLQIIFLIFALKHILWVHNWTCHSDFYDDIYIYTHKIYFGKKNNKKIIIAPDKDIVARYM